MPKRNTAIRNYVARSPLMRKGGAHVQSKTGRRLQGRLSTQQAVDEWWQDEEEDQQEENGEQELPVFLCAMLIPISVRTINHIYRPDTAHVQEKKESL